MPRDFFFNLGPSVDRHTVISPYNIARKKKEKENPLSPSLEI